MPASLILDIHISIQFPMPLVNTLKAGLPEGHSLAGYYGFNANIALTSQAVKNLYAHPTDLCSGLFCKFFGDFWVYL